MASPDGLRLYFGRALPPDLLQLIWEYGWNVWLGKPHDVDTYLYEDLVCPLVSYTDIKPDVLVSTIEVYEHWYDEYGIDSDDTFEKKHRWADFFAKHYLHTMGITRHFGLATVWAGYFEEEREIEVHVPDDEESDDDCFDYGE